MTGQILLLAASAGKHGGKYADTGTGIALLLLIILWLVLRKK